MKPRVAALLGFALVLLAFAWFVRQLSLVSFGLAANDEVQQQLRASLEDQKKLARLDPPSNAAYRARFATIERLLVHMGVLEHSRAELARQIEIALVGAVAAILGAAIAALIAAQRRRDRRRLQYLEHLAAWQEAARRHAHEIRTPLTAAQMEVDRLVSLVERKLPAALGAGALADVHQARTSIREELERLRAFTKSFTSFATIGVPRPGRHDLAVLVEEFCTAFASAWPKLRLELERASGDCHVLADRNLLRQVLVNLCTNSALALRDTPGTVRFSLRRQAAKVLLDVADDGPGIDAAVRPRLFEPYTTTRPVGEGMGLGLAISKKIMLDHGGDLELIESGLGATFRLTLAAAPTEASA